MNNYNDELHSRREFFKKAARGILPIISAIVLGSGTQLVKAMQRTPTGCESACFKSCDFVCTETCERTCTGFCTAACNGSCTSTCQGRCRDDCSGKCTTTCFGSCRNTCNNTCYGSCFWQMHSGVGFW